MPNTSPPIFSTKVPTAEEWKAYFAAKVDGTAGVLTDGAVVGGTVTGATISAGTIAGALTDASLRTIELPSTCRAPSPRDNDTRGYKVGDRWLDHAGIMWECLSATGEALWIQVAGLPAYPMAGQAAAAVLYGTVLLHPDWTGESITITRDSDSDTLDVPLIVRAPFRGKVVDQAMADAFCAGTIGRITKAFDQTGNGLHATADVGHAPVWDSTKQINGIPVISFQSRKFAAGDVTLTDQYMVLPAGLAWNMASCTWLIAGAVNNPGSKTAGAGGLVSVGAGNNGWCTSYSGKGIHVVGANTNSTAATHMTTTPSVTCVSGGSSFSRMYQNGDFEQFAQSTSASGNGGFLGYDTVNGGGIMSLGAFALWTSQLSTTSTEPSVIQNFEAAFGIQRQFDHLVLVMGASSDSGSMSTTGSSWPFEAAALLPPGVRIINNSYHGAGIAGTLFDFADMCAAAYARHRGATAETVTIVVTPAGNDISADVPFVTVQANTQAYNTLSLELGSNVEVVVATKFMQGRYVSKPDQIAALQEYNDWLFEHYATPIAQGGAGASQLVDQFNCPFVSDGDYVGSSLSNDVSPDNLHLRSRGQSAVGMLFANGIRRTLRSRIAA